MERLVVEKAVVGVRACVRPQAVVCQARSKTAAALLVQRVMPRSHPNRRSYYQYQLECLKTRPAHFHLNVVLVIMSVSAREECVRVSGVATNLSCGTRPRMCRLALLCASLAAHTTTQCIFSFHCLTACLPLAPSPSHPVLALVEAPPQHLPCCRMLV